MVTASSVTADTTSSNSTAKSPAQIKEEKRKAIQAARLQRERELAALLAEEQALMEGEQCWVLDEQCPKLGLNRLLLSITFLNCPKLP